MSGTGIGSCDCAIDTDSFLPMRPLRDARYSHRVLYCRATGTECHLAMLYAVSGGELAHPPALTPISIITDVAYRVTDIDSDISLRARCAMAGTDRAQSPVQIQLIPTSLCTCYALSSTNLAQLLALIRIFSAVSGTAV
eukprot:1289667-Rhodomonas_salina.1